MLHNPRGQGAQDPAQRMVGAQLIVAVDNDQQRPGALQPPP